jgi:hypothetical protein
MNVVKLKGNFAAISWFRERNLHLQKILADDEKISGFSSSELNQKYLKAIAQMSVFVWPTCQCLQCVQLPAYGSIKRTVGKSCSRRTTSTLFAHSTNLEIRINIFESSKTSADC